MTSEVGDRRAPRRYRRGMAVGELLREWRQRRHLSQLDVSLDAAVSARHLSFIETGRSRPSREMVLHLAEYLEVPLRERNALLLAAGYAPAYAETPLADGAMAPVRAAVDKVLSGHEPYPAVIVDRRWDLVSANASAGRLMALVDPALLQPPVNAMRLMLHPDGLARHVVNLAEYSAHLLSRLRREALLAGDAELDALHAELRGYPGVRDGSPVAEPEELVVAPLRLRTPAGELSLFSTIATFGTALDITAAELAIEAFYPADTATADALRAGTRS
jgi:transcriptional regulator with XRE-family HTH domain